MASFRFVCHFCVLTRWILPHFLKRLRLQDFSHNVDILPPVVRAFAVPSDGEGTCLFASKTLKSAETAFPESICRVIMSVWSTY